MCRFLIADLTDENRGAYWEAGYAEGLGKPVIYTCKKSVFDEQKTHFDTNHCQTVLWDPNDPLKDAIDLKATIRATLPFGAKINVCRPVPFVVLKALALSGRGMLKDAYDLVYVLRHYKDDPASVAAELRDDAREQKSFHRAVDILKKHFKNDRQDGPVKYQAFIPSEPNAAFQAYAVVQEFLDALR